MTGFIHRTYEPLKFLGRLFWVPLRVLPNTKAVSYAPTWEESGERWGPTIVARIPLTSYAIGLGVWLDVDPLDIVAIRDEDAEYAAYTAVNGPVDREEYDAARRYIASLGLDPDEEMEAMQALGLFQ